MEVGIGSYAFRWATGPSAPRASSCAQMIDETARLGCTLLQIADNRELDAMDAGQLTALRAHAAHRDVRLQVGFTGARTALLRRYLDIAQRLEADVVRVVLHEDAEAVDDRSAARALGEVAADYERAAIGIGIENHFLTTSPQMLKILRDVGEPGVGVIVDVANSIVCGEWPQETVTALAPWAIGVHLKDYDIEPDPDGVGARIVGRPLGQGRTRIDDLLRTLNELGRTDVGVVLEQWSPRLGSIEESIELETMWRTSAVEHARRFIGAADEVPA
ncbi:sugar phosphate isomerase/epimerase [Georgenia halophila]|uniref:Sugar phosphate isomerase/epimerase n=1 Tax=Georgenia halophila TaxID=620889 RepID=A0ABP8LLM1_9MICO